MRTARLALVSATLVLLGACSSDPTALLEEMASRNAAIREDAVVSAGDLVHPDVTTALEHLLEDPDEEIRAAAVLSLDKHRSATSVRPLMAHVLDPDPLVRSYAIDVLGRFGDPVATPALEGAIVASWDDPPLNAIWALGRVGAKDSVVLLGRLRGGHDDAWVRYTATEALREIE
jgi:HEAT repeat protein